MDSEETKDDFEEFLSRFFGRDLNMDEFKPKKVKSLTSEEIFTLCVALHVVCKHFGCIEHVVKNNDNFNKTLRRRFLYQ